MRRSPGAVGGRRAASDRPAHRGSVAALLAVLLAGCTFNGPMAEPSYYDLGAQADLGTQAPRFALRNVEVVAPTWLDAPAIQYRLAYASPTQRLSYAESRWVASPPELLEVALRRAIVSNESMALSGGCKLRVDLDEFVQVFEAPDSSFGQIELRAAVLAPKNDLLLARRSFTIGRPATRHDARGAVAALSTGVGQLTLALRDWLATLDREASPGLNIGRTCRGQ